MGFIVHGMSSERRPAGTSSRIADAQSAELPLPAEQRGLHGPDAPAPHRQPPSARSGGWFRHASAADLALCGAVSDAGEAVQFSCRLLAPDAARRSVALRVEGEPRAPVLCERWALRRIALEVLTEALRRSPAGGEVSIVVKAVRGATLLRVTEDGAENVAPCGLGAAGLDRAGDLIEAASGTILLDGRPGGGSIVSIRLPRPVESRASGVAS